jgi:hypothetical protein
VAGTTRLGVRFAMHRGWQHRNGRNVLEDVALVQLDAPASGVAPVTLGGPLPDRVKIAGGGFFTPTPLGEDDDQLRIAELRTITDERCARAYRRRRGHDGERFHAAQMHCATDIDGLPPLSSPCFGDSGGPLYSGSEGAPVIHGIVSWGGTRCGADHLPSVYASVRRARDFITARAPTWAPVPNGHAVISGRPRPGHRLDCAVPSWTVPPTRIQVRWARPRDGPPLKFVLDEPVGHDRTYRVRRRDIGFDLDCSIRASNAGGVISVHTDPYSLVHVPG